MTSNYTHNKSTLANGILFIPDISGYSAFVKETNEAEGASIVAALLDALISANRLSFKISEIEGDAILFYKQGKPYPIQLILKQFERMIKAFNEVKKNLMANHPQVAKLSIKLIVHYGPIAEYTIRGFTKLYGKAVVEAHRLMKNSVDQHSYVLISETYMQEAISSSHQNLVSDRSISQCEIYQDVGRLCYAFFPNN